MRIWKLLEMFQKWRSVGWVSDVNLWGVAAGPAGEGISWGDYVCFREAPGVFWWQKKDCVGSHSSRSKRSKLRPLCATGLLSESFTCWWSGWSPESRWQGCCQGCWPSFTLGASALRSAPSAFRTEEAFWRGGETCSKEPITSPAAHRGLTLEKKNVSRLNVSCHGDVKAIASGAALCLPLPSVIVVASWHDANFLLTFINSWQRAAPEFPMIPPVLCVILPHLSLFARSHSVPLMVELLTLFVVPCTLDTALIFPACVTEHCFKAGSFIARSKLAVVAMLMI